MTEPAKKLDVFEDVGKAAEYLRAGGILLYPTETFYAIGCMADNIGAIKHIYCIKKRAREKPLPLLAASAAQAALAARVDEAPPRLLTTFWPGPLTVVLTATNKVSVAACKGKIAIRVTSGQFAASLARFCGFPLVCTSANSSGNNPVNNFDDLDPDFLAAAAQYNCAAAISPLRSESRQGLPSTIVEPVRDSAGQWHLRVIREGCVSRKILTEQNFNLSGQ